jgi:hypothetical protein
MNPNGAIISKFLNDHADDKNCKNWHLLSGIGQRFRYYLIEFKRCDNVPVKLLREDTETDLAQDVTLGFRRVELHHLEFWLSAQRDFNDW